LRFCYRPKRAGYPAPYSTRAGRFGAFFENSYSSEEIYMKHSTVIISDNKNPSIVFGVHGGTGTLLWKRLATGSHLHGDWDGFEWVALEPGDRVGKHTHTHTEEIFYFLAGTGLVMMDGVEQRVRPGDLVVTPLNSWQSVINDGRENLEYIVIEVFPPAISQKLPSRRPTDEKE
jgi:mannose-6-phosphate isomerase-like protein (cupin superfamily)